MEETNNQLLLFKIRDLRKKDQFKIDDVYLNGYARVCKPVATAVYNSLCRHAEFHSQRAFPSQELIAYQHNISVDTVSRAIKKLVEYNIVMVQKERKDGKFMNYVYTLLDKSGWKPINQTAKTGYGSTRPQKTRPQKTRLDGNPTKDNKVFKDNKDIKDYKEGEEIEQTPAEEMKSFLEDESYFQKLVGFLTNEKGLPENKVIEELNNFKGYWGERTKDGTKQRWQLEKTFELKRRLGTWFKNAPKFNNQDKGRKISVAFKI